MKLVLTHNVLILIQLWRPSQSVCIMIIITNMQFNSVVFVSVSFHIITVTVLYVFYYFQCKLIIHGAMKNDLAERLYENLRQYMQNVHDIYITCLFIIW